MGVFTPRFPGALAYLVGFTLIGAVGYVRSGLTAPSRSAVVVLGLAATTLEQCQHRVADQHDQGQLE